MVVNAFESNRVGMIRTKFIKSCLFVAIMAGVAAVHAPAVHAQPVMGSPVPSFMPVGGWQVSPTSLSEIRGLPKIKLPCMMMTNYDNGYIVRLSGGGQSMLAMAIDFRQNVFVQGRKYNAVVNLNNGYTRNGEATAFSQSVLIFNVRPFNGFYQALQQASAMMINIENNAFEFSLGDLGAATQRLEACFSGNMSVPPTGVPMGPTPAGMTTLPEPPAPGEENKSPAPMAPAVSTGPNWNEKVSPAPSQRPAMPLSAQQTRWEAKAGDDIRMTLQRWAGNAGVALDWQSDRGGQVVSDISITGTFEDAVQVLMAQNAAVMGLEANMMGAGTQPAAYSSYGQPQQLMPPQQPMMGATVNRHDMNAAGIGSGRWNAPAGSSLQQVLAIWSRQAGVELIWESNEGFAVKAPVSMNGSYEDALQKLLNQYVSDSVRPAAQLNNDPISGRRVLLVQSTRI